MPDPTDRNPPLGLRASRRRLKHPLPGAHFRVFIGSHEIGVRSVSALELQDPDPVDGTILQTVVLARAIGHDKTLFSWRAAVAAGKDDRREVTIAQLEAPGAEPVNLWRLTGARPLRWTGPEFDAQSPELAFEELEITYDTIEWRASA